jgi:hypothetical protein
VYPLLELIVIWYVVAAVVAGESKCVIGDVSTVLTFPIPLAEETLLLDPTAVPAPMIVVSRLIPQAGRLEAVPLKDADTITRTLLVEEVGVIAKLIPVFCAVAEVVENVNSDVRLTTCSIFPPAGISLVKATVPVLAGNVSVFNPASAGAAIVIAPLVFPAITIELITYPLLSKYRYVDLLRVV